MPDISKLPELAELFSTTIDELLGRPSLLLEKAAEGKLDELLPFISNAMLVSLARKAEAQGQSCVSCAPFLPGDALSDIALAWLQKGRSINDLLPFVGESLIARLAEAAAAND